MKGKPILQKEIEENILKVLQPSKQPISYPILNKENNSTNQDSKVK